jgi:hypothetical protein
MTIDVKDAGGVTRTIETPNANGRAGAAASRPVVLASEDLAAVNAIATALGGTLAAQLASGEAHIGRVGGESAVVAASFTRPADTTAYAVGDLVANSTTAGGVAPLSLAAARVNAGTGLVRRVRLSTSHTGLAGNEQFRVHLFKTAPTCANGDNGAFSVNGIAAVHLGFADVTLDRVFSDGSKGVGVPASGSDILFDAGAGSQNIYALIEARGAYTPASGESFTLALEVLRD